MTRQITMPEKEASLSETDVKAMDRPQCAEAIRSLLERYKRQHGLQTNAGPGMMLLARAMELMLAEPTVLPPEVAATPEGYVACEVPEKHWPTVKQTIEFLQQTDPV